MTKAKRIAQELVEEIDGFPQATNLEQEACDMIRSQAAEIERLKDYSRWYGEAMTASNEAGFVGLSAEQTIRKQAAEIERLKAKLIECRSSVKFYCNDYDRFMLRKEPHANQCDRDEQKRLHDLLDWIDALENKHD